jgi:hypothetical protein
MASLDMTKFAESDASKTTDDALLLAAGRGRQNDDVFWGTASTAGALTFIGGPLIAFFWLMVFKKAPGTLIWFCIAWVVGFWFVLAVIMLVLNVLIAAAIFVVIGLCVAALVKVFIVPRIPMAKSFMQVSSLVVNRNMSLTCVSMCGMFIYAVALIWILACTIFSVLHFGYERKADNSLQDNSHAVSAVVFFYQFWLLWTTSILLAVLHCVCAGTFGAWYFDAEKPEVNTVKASLGRALGSSFGSICFGALVVAILKLIKEQLRKAQEGAGNNLVACCLLCIVRCICSMVLDLVEFINDLAYCQVAIFGKAYVPAVKDTINLLFSCNGWNLMLADCIIGNVVSFVVFMSLLLGAGVGFCLGYFMTHGGSSVGHIIVGVVCAVVGALWWYVCISFLTGLP